jgi:hypothetical protein
LIALAAALVAGIGFGVVLDRFILPHSSVVVSGAGDSNKRNPNVTKETYVKIKPEMSSWEVDDLLGAGQIIAEEGFIVDAQGRYRKYRHGGAVEEESTGTVNGPDGQAKQEIKQEVVWRDGGKAIYVTFLNNKVVNRREEGLYRE